MLRRLAELTESFLRGLGDLRQRLRDIRGADKLDLLDGCHYSGLALRVLERRLVKLADLRADLLLDFLKVEAFLKFDGRDTNVLNHVIPIDEHRALTLRLGEEEVSPPPWKFFGRICLDYPARPVSTALACRR